jgi:hypothetical protein
MKKLFYTFIALLFSACAGFQTVTLTQEQPLAHQDSATMNAPTLPVMNFNNGIFLDSKTDLSKWEASHANMSVGRSGTSLAVELKGVGNEWEQLSRKFEALNFTDAPYLLVKARIDVGSKDSLKMRIDLIDENGYATNYVPQERYIRSRPDVKVYKFAYAGNWVQNWPSRKDVDAKSIVEIKINFNGGGPNYTGKLFIEEIIAFDGKKKDVNPNNYALLDFSDGASGWWSANSITVTGEEIDSKDVMKVALDGAGPGWEGIGYRFDNAIDFGKTPILKLRMKADKPGKLRIDINDAKDYSTNASPLLIDFQATQEYVDVFYDYRNKFAQSWPNAQKVDSTQIKSIKFHVNPPPDNPPFTGTLLIDDLVLMSEEEYNKFQK